MRAGHLIERLSIADERYDEERKKSIDRGTLIGALGGFAVGVGVTVVNYIYGVNSIPLEVVSDVSMTAFTTLAGGLFGGVGVDVFKYHSLIEDQPQETKQH